MCKAKEELISCLNSTYHGQVRASLTRMMCTGSKHELNANMLKGFHIFTAPLNQSYFSLIQKHNLKSFMKVNSLELEKAFQHKPLQLEACGVKNFKS